MEAWGGPTCGLTLADIGMGQGGVSDRSGKEKDYILSGGSARPPLNLSPPTAPGSPWRLGLSSGDGNGKTFLKVWTQKSRLLTGEMTRNLSFWRIQLCAGCRELCGIELLGYRFLVRVTWSSSSQQALCQMDVCCQCPLLVRIVRGLSFGTLGPSILSEDRTTLVLWESNDSGTVTQSFTLPWP